MVPILPPPPSSHFPIAKVLYSEKITNNIFLEKPLATTFAEASELSQIADIFGGANGGGVPINGLRSHLKKPMKYWSNTP